MSMNRNDALHQLAAGIRKSEGLTAGQLLDTSRTDLNGLPPTDARVVLRVTHAQKTAWVRASQAEGKKLTAWIINRIENQE